MLLSSSQSGESLVSRQNKTVSISIDGRILEVPKDLTILQAAKQNNIYIPSLCAHEDLSPHGGCRMCIVEIEGVRGLPIACTTLVENNMVVRTQTAEVQAVRTEILQLFLSEHTSSCLICDEKEECKLYSSTIRKAGVTTGCRFCPNDGQCELQDVTEYLGITDLTYPIYYRNLRVEKEDPFYDRDYNLCILCGRCVRICQEIRTADVLAFNNRGRDTVIGPAFGRTHLESGCEFCGACVSICPTGALSEKARKWEGKPDREEETTCPFCSVGCQMNLLVKDDRIVGSLPTDDKLVNNGQLCVKGRFCISEMVNGYTRLLYPCRMVDSTRSDITWDDAIDLAVQKLSECQGDDFGLLVSPNCCNEDLYVAQKFARVVMGTNNVDTSARIFYGSGFNAYLNLMRKATPLSNLQKTNTVLCVGLDTRFGRSVVGVEIRKAIQRGAKLITINPRDHNLTTIAEKWLHPMPGEEIKILQDLVKLTAKKALPHSKGGKNDDNELMAVAQLLSDDASPMILLGSEFLQYDYATQILEAVEQLAQNVGADMMPLPSQNNLFGSILAGAYPELLPGGASSTSKKKLSELKKLWGKTVPAFKPGWNVASNGKRKLKVLYLVGETLPIMNGTSPEFVIHQNIYPSDPLFEADLMLPAAAFTETDGTFINGEGRIQRVRKGVDPPGQALPDWRILCNIAKKMGADGFNFANVASIRKEMAAVANELADINSTRRAATPLGSTGEFVLPKRKSTVTSRTDRKYPFILTSTVTEHTHRGFPLTTWVEGSVPLFGEETIDINLEDALKARIESGDEVIVTSPSFKKTWPARIIKEQARGTLHVTLHPGQPVGPNPEPVRIRKKNV